MKFSALLGLAVACFATLAVVSSFPRRDQVQNGDQEESISYHPVSGKVLQSKALPPTVQTQADCLSKTWEKPFTLQAVSFNLKAGLTSVPLHIYGVNTLPKVTWSILSTKEGVLDFNSVLKDGGIQGISDSQPYLISNSLAVVRGESPTFITIQYPGPASGPYCTMRSPLGPGAPNVLGVDGHNDLFALCLNLTVGGREDVVFDPVANHDHYTKADCKHIYITLTDFMYT
ncbi:hypothetical protein C8R44DRAFT_877362 [Mycena epipterygia]|nr:hypothetical protein C8R44DRAFT_877362 [Mycena epipterygia]